MITKDEARNKIASLVERFEEQKDFYKRSEYNETLTRRDFIDPFFKALGWDIDNEQGYAESYREVIHEDKIKVGGATKAPDYSFRLPGGKRLFFVEAKKPSVLIKDEITPAYQVRRYGWSAKLPISIITDFEEFALYDCTKKPNLTDKASFGRIKYITYQNYLSEFDFIWDTFSKERVLKGSFDKFIQSDKQKKGTATVDYEFLHSLDTWRTYLANNIALRNTIGEDELNYVVQHIIDRIIFLRIAEDRSVEPYGNLQETLKNGIFYENLLKQFHTADQKYNSGLFDFNKDKISRTIEIDNKIIKSIISDLYYPACPYEFSVLSVEILGSAYEQFLGKTISLSKTGRAVIEEKLEVRKAGGVYYTPQYIVDYIVKNTVGKSIERKTPKEISKIKIVDPACGSGSFLIGAYQYLLQYHKDYYTNFGKTSKGNKDNPLTPEGNLTTAEKKRILLNNIYGVDLDSNAVEVTKLSLLLKCMEGETEASINTQLKLFHERVLPTLDNNIKDGNSLINIDFYGGEIDFGQEKKVKPFNWRKAFPEVFMQGGFDCVIGNPPYLGGREWKEDNGNAYEYFINKYEVAEYQFDIYALFWEVGITLLKDEGLIGYITPNTWLNNQSNKKLRQYILRKTQILQIVDYSKIKVFDQATVLPIITVLQNTNSHTINTNIFEPKDGEIIQLQEINQGIWADDDLSIININLSTKDLKLRDKIEADSHPLESLALIKFGIKIYETGKGTPKQKATDAKQRIFEADKQKDKSYRKYLEGKDINPFKVEYKNRWLKYGINLAAPRDPLLFEGERILVRRIVGKTLIAAYTNSDYVTSQLLQIVKPNEQRDTKFLLGIINSKLLAYYFRKKYNRQDKTFPEIRIYELASLPIRKPNESQNTLKKEIEKLVDKIIELQENKGTVILQSKIDQIQNQIDYCEQKLNDIVYALYGLTSEEVELIENS
jgi:type I restriction-modification system DNA methylase subunit